MSPYDVPEAMTEPTADFTWSNPKLDKKRFSGLTNLLALRNGGQVEQALQYDPSLDEDLSTEQDDTESLDTGRPGRIATSGQSSLKRRLLDNLAELFANEKGGKTVTCTSMRECEENVTIWVTRNEGFRGSEKEMCERLCTLLERGARVPDDKTASRDLWNTMLIFYKSRLECSSIPGIRKGLKECQSLIFSTISEGEFAPALHELTKLFEVTFNDADDKVERTATEQHDRLITAAYEAQMTRSVRELLWNSRHTTSKAKKLWENIYFLGRLRMALEIFREAVSTFPSFRGLNLVLVEGDNWKGRPPQSNPLSLEQTFKLQGVKLNSSTVKSILGPKWSVGNAEKRFAALQKEKPKTHAEVQMIRYLLQQNIGLRDIFRYFGCSKKSCVMCWHFLQAMNQIQTRGCHGRLFKPWVVLQTSRLVPGIEDIIARTLLGVERALKETLKGEEKRTLAHERTSVVGGTSIFSTQRSKNNESMKRKEEIERRRMKSEQERVTAKFARLFTEEAQSTTNKGSRQSWDEPGYVGQCYICGASTARKCSMCNKDFYCSEACEEKRSGSHLFSYAKRPLTSADYLYRDVLDDRLPTDEDVLSDFGFNRLPSFADKSKLLGLYVGLMKYQDVPVEDVHRWQVDGSLTANIKEVFFQVPERCRGGYFGWFLNNTEILDGPVTKEEAVENLKSRWFEEARLHLDPEDQGKEPKDLRPKAKLEAYLLFVAALHQGHPHPTDQIWLNFGFCTCRGEMEEGRLGSLFSQLLFGYGPYEDILRDKMPNLKGIQKPHLPSSGRRMKRES